jgi:carbon-monoxide dehydrogenase large subunit
MFETVAREQMVDEVARDVGIDPLEWRRRNVIPTAEIPYTLPTGLTLEYASPEDTLEQAAEMIGYEAFRRDQRRAFDDEGRLLGIGLGLYVEPSTGMMDPLGTETAVVRVHPTGSVTVSLGTGSHGQGIETTMAQVVAEELGIGLDDVVVLQGDTNATTFGRGTGGSGTAVIAGNSCRLACADVRAKAIEIAAHLMEASPADLELRDGAVAVRGTPSRNVSFAEVAHVAHLETARLPAGMQAGLEASATFKAPPMSWSNACHACTVEVDRHTGVVRILRYVVSEDCGVMINPRIVEGQIAGGVVQGIAGALYEHVVYDDDGNPLTATFMDYLLPTATEVPVIEYGHVETPSATPGGHKGMGEGGAIGSPPTVFNAVADALALVGARVDRTPLSPDAILTAFAQTANLRY